MMYPRAYGNKGYSLAMLEFYAEAIEQYSQCLKLLPNAVDVLYLRGKSFLEQGNEEKACLDFKLSSKLGYELANKYASLCEE